MAIPELDKIYRDRVEALDTQGFEITDGLAQNFETWRNRFDMDKARRIGFGLLAFGRFTSSGNIECQPWALDRKVVPPRLTGGYHEFAAQELLYIHSQTGALGLDGPKPNSRITPMALFTYICLTDAGETNVIVRNYSNASLGRGFTYGKNEVAALERATEPNGPMHDHTLFVPEGRSWFGYTKVAGGIARFVELRRKHGSL